MNKIQKFLEPHLKKDLPAVRPGQFVKITQKIKEGEKERLYAFEGQVLARKHGKEIGATIIVRRMISGVGVETVLPLHLPTIEKIEILKEQKVRRAKLYYLRKAKGKRAKLKEK
jgi:large subunit ribosomal protein L19